MMWGSLLFLAGWTLQGLLIGLWARWAETEQGVQANARWLQSLGVFLGIPVSDATDSGGNTTLDLRRMNGEPCTSEARRMSGQEKPGPRY